MNQRPPPRFEFPLMELVMGGSLQEPLRFIVALLSIALGVALGYAIQLINHQAKSEFVRAARDLSGEAHVSVQGPREGFSETLYPRLARIPEVEAASPALELSVKVVGRDEPLKLMGVDIFRASVVQPGLALPQFEQDSLDFLRADRVFLNASARKRLGVSVGDTLLVQAGMTNVSLRVAGTLNTSATFPLAAMDIAAAQFHFGRIGAINRIDLKFLPGADRTRTQADIDQLLPPGVSVITPSETQTTAAKVSRAYRVNLNVLALVALFTGALLVYATQWITIRKRGAQLALWRALGATRNQVRFAVLLEGAATGLIGSVVGLALGYGLANAVLHWSEGNLGSGSRPMMSTVVDFSIPLALAIGFCGIFAALLGSLAPSSEGARLPISSALRSHWNFSSARALRRTPWGLGLLLLGMVLCFAPPIDGLPVFGYGAIACLLIGSLALLPWFVDALCRKIKEDWSLSLTLSAAQLRHSLPEVSVSLSATVAAVSLTVSMAIMVASFRESLDHWLDRALPADLYVRAGQPNDTAFFDTDTQDRMRKIVGVKRVQFQRAQQISLDPNQPPVTLLARDTSGMDPTEFLPIMGATIKPADRKLPALWVTEVAADLYGFKPGDHVSVPIAGHAVDFVVAGVWRDYVRQQGALLVDRSMYLQLTGDHRVTESALWLDPGQRIEEIIASIRRMPGGEQIDIASPGDLREISLSIFDRTFAITYALEAVAIIIGLVGLSSSVSALILTRKREFGVLRHLGFTRARIRGMLTAEGLMTTGAGVFIGLLLGWIMSLVLIHVVNRQSFHWSMDLSMPWLGLSVFSGGLLLLSLVTSWWSARQAVGDDVLRAVKEDW